MIIVGKTEFDFEMVDEAFALDLYGKWDTFFSSRFDSVAGKVFAEADRADEVMHIESLVLDLGVLTEEEFYDKFPLRLAERLRGALREVMLYPQQNRMKCYPMAREYYEVLTVYLVEGYLGSGAVDFNIEKYIREVMREGGVELCRFLKGEGHRKMLRRRLVFRLGDRMLETLVELTEPEEAPFIVRYTAFLIRNYTAVCRPGIMLRDYRDMVWLLVLAYLWSVNRSRTERKELVRYTLMGLSARFGLSFTRWLRILTEVVRDILAGDPAEHGLAEILEELSYENRLQWLVENRTAIRISEIPERLLGKLKQEEFPGGQEEKEDAGEWRRYLADNRTRRKILAGLTEEEIGVLLRGIVPSESAFLCAYAAVLEQEKERGLFEGKAGVEFRYVKWDFIFIVLLNSPSGVLNKKSFVEGVLHRLAAHYGLDYCSLLDYFRQEQGKLPVWLEDILFGLEREAMRNNTLEWIRLDTGISPERLREISELLQRPVSCRILLGQLKEKEIFRLLEWLMPQEKEFVLCYARNLDRGQQQGMFVGRAGKEFCLLKWEFIFLLSLGGTFNRKQFALQVLEELGAHYALSVRELLDYFYHSLEDGSSEADKSLQQLIRELWMDLQEKPGEIGSRLMLENEESRVLRLLELYFTTGTIPEGGQDFESWFNYLKERNPRLLFAAFRKLRSGIWDCPMAQTAGTIRVHAQVLLWLMKQEMYGQAELCGLLREVAAGKKSPAIGWLRRLLCCWQAGEREGLERIAKNGELPEAGFTEADFPVITALLSGFGQREVAGYLRRRKEEIWRWMRVLSEKNTALFGQLLDFIRMTLGVAAFCEELWGREEYAELVRTFAGEETIVGELPELPEFCRADLGVLREWWERGEHRQQVLALLSRNPDWQKRWVEYAGGMVLRRMGDEWLRLEKYLPMPAGSELVWKIMLKYTLPEYSDCPAGELSRRLLEEIRTELPERDRKELAQVLHRPGVDLPEWKKILGQMEMPGPARPPESHYLWRKETEKNVLIEVHNAGLVLFTPWFLQLFRRLGLYDEEGKRFMGPEAQVRAVFVLQALADGPEERGYEEHELFLNRLLAGLSREEALPASLVLTEQEQGMVYSLTENLRANWPGMKNTSLEGMRQSFLQREGILEERAKEWTLTVNPSGIDILLDNLPWGYSRVKLPWMEKMLRVEWRS